MSAHALASERETAIATGRDEFDAKPIELESPNSAHRCEPEIIHPHGFQDGGPLGRRTVNTEPLPGSLVTVTSPPIMRASLRLMARPKPVPPKRRAVNESA